MRAKRLTLKEKKHIGSIDLRPENWLMHKRLENEWILVNKNSGKSRRISGNKKVT